MARLKPQANNQRHVMNRYSKTSTFHWLSREIHKRQTSFAYKSLWQRLHIDPPLTLSLVVLMVIGLFILYSAASSDTDLVIRQLIRLSLATGVMFIFAQIPPRYYQIWSPWFFAVALLMLLAVLAVGSINKGAQRWLDLWILRFQPSELMKLVLPLMLAQYFSDHTIPPSLSVVAVALLMLLIPFALIIKQPDLGTALVIAISGGSVILFAGISWRWLTSVLLFCAACVPLLWPFLHDYQQQRVFTFLDPERDPLGKGYHIIQSKIAIGSGGVFGKGWLNGTQSHLHFLPEHATDFIYAVCGEELGLIGCMVLVTIYFIIAARTFYIATQAQDTFTRLVASSLGLTFFISAFINMGMVTGMLPVVGMPLPLVSYGGTSMVTLMAGFGIVMSIHTHRKLLAK